VEDINYSDVVKIMRNGYDEADRCRCCGKNKFERLYNPVGNVISVVCIDCSTKNYFDLIYLHVLDCKVLIVSRNNYLVKHGQDWFGLVWFIGILV